MTAVLDFLKSVNPDTLTPAEAQEYLRVLGSWQQRIAGAAPSTPVAPASIRKVDTPRAISKTAPQPMPSVQQLAVNAVPHGPGDFKNISIRYRRAFGVILSHGKLQKAAYCNACVEHGEDRVLAAFDSWAPGNMWIKEKGHTAGLYQLYEALPSILTADELVQADDEKVKREKEKEQAAVTDAVEAGRAETLKKAIARQQKKRADELAAKFAEQNPEELFS